jgi:hypothetical protein
VRLFSSLQLVVAATSLPTRSTHVYDFSSPRLDHLAMGRPPLLAVRWPIATGLASISQVAFRHRSAVAFLPPPTLGRFSRALPRPRVLPGALALFVPPFGVFSLADPARLRKRQSPWPVLIHSSNPLPSGNCDSPKSETLSGYLIRLGTVSHRSSSLSPFFAFTSEARTSPEELVNYASAPMPFSTA